MLRGKKREGTTNAKLDISIINVKINQLFSLFRIWIERGLILNLKNRLKSYENRFRDFRK